MRGSKLTMLVKGGPRELGQYHVFWCDGPSCQQVITIHDIYLVLATSAVMALTMKYTLAQVLTTDKKMPYILIPQNNLSRKQLK